MKKLPNLIIIGAMKSGTTSLYYYLNLHPEIFMSKTKVLDFFIPEYNCGKGIEWYKSTSTGKSNLYGEITPVLDSKLREELISILKDDINQRSEYPGCDYKDWSL